MITLDGDSSKKGLQFSLEEGVTYGANIKLIGIGGAGGDALNRMIDAGLQGVEFIAIDTDVQALRNSKATTKLQIGAKITRGLGAGATPETGRQAALEDRHRIIDAIEGADLVFVTAGLGGGTGTGAAPIVSQLAAELGALAVAVVTTPFAFEGQQRMETAERGLGELYDSADTLILLPNERLLRTVAPNTSLVEAFSFADDVLRQAVQGIADLVTVPGEINLDFADVKMIMSGMGMAAMGTGIAKGQNRAVEAANMAIGSPLLEKASIAGAHGILINITGGDDMTLYEVSEAAEIVHNHAHPEAQIIFGTVIDKRMVDTVKITVIATGFDQRATSYRLDPVGGQLHVPQRGHRKDPAAEGQLPGGVPKAIEQALLEADSANPDLDTPTFLRARMDDEEHHPTHGPSNFLDRVMAALDAADRIFATATTRDARSAALRRLRDAVISSGNDPTSDESTMALSGVYNALWRVSQSEQAYAELLTSIRLSLDKHAPHAPDSSLYRLIAFLHGASATTGLAQMARLDVPALDTDSACLARANIVPVIETLSDVIKATQLIPSEAMPHRELKRTWLLLSELADSRKHLEPCSIGSCISGLLSHWLRLVSEAWSIALADMNVHLEAPITLFAHRWNDLYVFISGVSTDGEWRVTCDASDDYVARIDGRVEQLGPHLARVKLSLTPRRVGDTIVRLHIEGLARQVAITVLRENPFVVGTPVRAPEMFVGRDAVIARIRRGIFAAEPPNVLITARRRMGKSSLLYALERSLSDEHIPLVISTEQLPPGVNGFQAGLAERIRHHVVTLGLFGSTADSASRHVNSPEHNPLERLLTILGETGIVTRNRRLVLLLDEAEALTRWDEPSQRALRFALSNMPHIRAVIAGPPDILSRASEVQPLFNIFSMEMLGPFTVSETRALLATTLEREFSDLDLATASVHEASGGVPLYVQAMGYEIVEGLARGTRDERELLQNALMLGRKHCHVAYHQITRYLSPEGKLALVATAEGRRPALVAGQRLEELQLVRREKNRLVVTAGWEREWILEDAENLLDEAGICLWQEYGKDLSLSVLAGDIEAVLNLCKTRGQVPEGLRLALAAARGGRGARALANLGRLGDWAVDIAEDAGKEALGAVIRSALSGG